MSDYVALLDSHGALVDIVEIEADFGAIVVHKDLKKPDEWMVTHRKSGLTASGKKGSFKTFEIACDYAKTMSEYDVDWDFDNRNQMIARNTLEKMQMCYQIARCKAEGEI